MTGAVYNKSYKATKNTLGAPLLRRFGRRDAQGEINVAKEQKSKKYQGVYYRELEGGDRSYFLRVRLGEGEPIPNIKPNIKTDLETRIAELKVRIGG